MVSRFHQGVRCMHFDVSLDLQARPRRLLLGVARNWVVRCLQREAQVPTSLVARAEAQTHRHIAMCLEVFLGGVWRTGAGELSVGVRGDNMLQFRPASKGKSEKFFFKSGQSTFHCIRSIQDRLQRAGRAKDPRYDAVHCGKPGLRCTMHCDWAQRPVGGRWL